MHTCISATILISQKNLCLRKRDNFWIGATIRTRSEIQCLPYARFLIFNYLEDQHKSEQVHRNNGELNTEEGPYKAGITNLGGHFWEGTQANLH